jgi:hypothetical protein
MVAPFTAICTVPVVTGVVEPVSVATLTWHCELAWPLIGYTVVPPDFEKFEVKVYVGWFTPPTRTLLQVNCMR